MSASVVYEDDWLIAYDKPSGLLIAPDRWDKSKACLTGLVHAEHPDWFNAHRIDRETSGVVVFAKSAAALKLLCACFERREVEKHYLALVSGCPDWDEKRLDAPLLADPRRRNLMRVDAAGKASSSTLRVLKRWATHALLGLTPHSGRSHQLRAHCRALGLPILSDPLYGEDGLVSSNKTKLPSTWAPSPLIARTALHAQWVDLPHPRTGQGLRIEAALPADFEVAMRLLDVASGTT